MQRRILLALGLVLLGTPLLFISTNREYSNLTPTPNQLTEVSLLSSESYQQTFTAQRLTLTCLGLWLRPKETRLPAENITITINRGSQILATSAVAASTLIKDEPSRVCFPRPLRTQLKEPLTFSISIPPTLDNAVSIQTRLPDGTFAENAVVFHQANRAQPTPLAFQTFYRYRPPLIVQLGGLLILSAILLLTPFRWQLLAYSLGLAFLFLTPLLLLQQFSWWLFGWSLLCLSILTPWLQHQGLTRRSAQVGATVVAFTTWLPLHVLYTWQPTVVHFPLALKEAFLDPNQVPPLHFFGSYGGIIAFALALVGLVWRGRTALGPLCLGLGSLILFWLSNHYPVLQHLTILSTAAMAYFAAWGLEGLYRYLGKDRLAGIICGTVAVLLLLDLWQVAAATMEYSVLH